jgi:fatty-acyl-CoA synthase
LPISSGTFQILSKAEAFCDPPGQVALLPQWLSSGSRLFGEAEALVSAGRRDIAGAVTFAELDSASRRLSAGMSRLGLAPGDAVAIWLPNCPAWFTAHFAAARSGLTTIPLNSWYKHSEAQYFIELSKARAIFIDSGFPGLDSVGTLNVLAGRGSCPSLRFLFDLNPEPAQVGGLECIPVGALGSTDEGEGRGRPENLAMIAFPTSGTTSKPKMAVHRETALVTHARAVASRAMMTSRDIVLGALPPCGAYGYILLLASMASGARALQMEWFDLDRLLDIIENERVTMIAVTEPILRRMLGHRHASRETFASLRLVFSAGGSLGPVVQRAEDEFGFTVTNVYGSSEVLALAAFWPSDTSASVRSAAGGKLVSPGMEVSAVDSDGLELPGDQIGELRFRGPVLATGYLRNPDATSKAFTADGWFHSNDLGSVDPGIPDTFRYISRMGDALRVKGFLVNPGEIEAKLQSHPAVAEAQAVGIAGGDGEEILVAFVVPKQDSDVSSEELREFCRADMASYKVPAAIGVLDEFPLTRSANGDKVMKRRLREMAEEMIVNA